MVEWKMVAIALIILFVIAFGVALHADRKFEKLIEQLTEAREKERHK